MSVSFSDLLDMVVGKEVRGQFHNRLEARNNTPSIKEHFLLDRGDPEFLQTSDTLWVVDRILEHQSIVEYIMAVVGARPLPTGETMDQPLDPSEFFLINDPISSWAPPPFDTESLVPAERMTSLIGCDEDPDRLQLISKELQAMKARLWEGIMPLSARRWRERKLYDPANFSAACQVLSMTVNVFLYLNHPVVRAALMETVNLIDDALRTFEEALNAKRALEDKPAVEVCKKWRQFVRARLDLMVNRTHGWVMDHVGQIKGRIKDQLDVLSTSCGRSGGTPDKDEQMRLLDMWQDISEIASKADYAILLPTNGYHGSSDPEPPTEYDFGTTPLRVAHPDIHQRNLDYHNRRGHWAMTLMAQQALAQLPGDDSVELLQQQDAAQQLVRAELRGDPVKYETEPWVVPIGEEGEWGFVAYRTCHTCSDAEWEDFRARFDADSADWGEGIGGLDGLRERSKVHWVDVRDLGVNGGDTEGLKSSFRSFVDTAAFPKGVATDMFLVADEASVSSYLHPQPNTSVPGDGGFITVIDVDYDPAKGLERADESPGYDGTMRVLGSLLWDDLSALVASFAQTLDTFWPLAMNHPARVYTGPVEKIRVPAGTGIE